MVLSVSRSTSLPTRYSSAHKIFLHPLTFIFISRLWMTDHDESHDPAKYIYTGRCSLSQRGTISTFTTNPSIMTSNNYATTGSLNYHLPPADGSRAYHNINADSATGERDRNWVEDPHVVDIENVRGSEDQYKLDVSGFQFGREASKHTSFLNDKEIEAEYYPQCTELIKKLTGASSAVIFDHSEFPTGSHLCAMGVLTMWTLAIRRRRPGEADDSPERRQPVSLVHVDQTTASSIARVHRHLPPSDAPALLKRRFQIINLWRPISCAALDWPLALCDFRSVDVKKDLAPVALIYPDREGETFGVKFNEGHKWKYMRGMEPDEFVLIKWYVSLASWREESVTETHLASIPCKMEVWLSLVHTLDSRTRIPLRERL